MSHNWQRHHIKNSPEKLPLVSNKNAWTEEFHWFVTIYFLSIKIFFFKKTPWIYRFPITAPVLWVPTWGVTLYGVGGFRSIVENLRTIFTSTKSGLFPLFALSLIFSNDGMFLKWRFDFDFWRRTLLRGDGLGFSGWWNSWVVWLFTMPPVINGTSVISSSTKPWFTPMVSSLTVQSA